MKQIPVKITVEGRYFLVVADDYTHPELKKLVTEDWEKLRDGVKQLDDFFTMNDAELCAFNIEIPMEPETPWPSNELIEEEPDAGSATK